MASEIVGQADRGDVHLALLEDLFVGQILGRVWPGDELHPARFHPMANGARLVVGHAQCFVVQGRLAEPFLEYAGGVQQVIGNDRVEHAHAALVEHAHDGSFAPQLLGQCLAQPPLLGRERDYLASGTTWSVLCFSVPFSSHCCRLQTACR